MNQSIIINQSVGVKAVNKNEAMIEDARTIKYSTARLAQTRARFELDVGARTHGVVDTLTHCPRKNFLFNDIEDYYALPRSQASRTSKLSDVFVSTIEGSSRSTSRRSKDGEYCLPPYVP